MVNRNVISSRIEQIDRHLKKIVPYTSYTLSNFLENADAQDIVEYNLFQCVNHLIDMMQHISVDEDYGLPGSAYEAAELLREHNVIDQGDLTQIKAMIGFRNVVGHDYLSIDKKVVYHILTSGLHAMKAIIGKIATRFL